MTPNPLASVPLMMSIRSIDAVALGNAAAARAVHADGVDLVEIGHRAVLLGEIADRRDRRDVAVHRVDALEGDELRARRTGSALSLASRSATSLWRKIALLAAPWRMPSIIDAWFFASEKMTQPGSSLTRVDERRVVGNVGGGEEKRGFLAVQVGELALELDVIVGGAGDVARAAGAGAHGVDRLVHGRRSPSGCWPMPR